MYSTVQGDGWDVLQNCTSCKKGSKSPRALQKIERLSSGLHIPIMVSDLQLNFKFFNFN